MATTKKAAASKKECTIVAIYKFKTNGKLNGTRCTLVRNGEGQEYQVWTHSNGCASSCTCEGFQKWHRKCYHIKEAEARVVACKPAVVATPIAPVVVAQPEVTVQPVIETAVAVAATETVVKQPAAARKMSSIEASMPAWMLTGRSNNGTFAGRGARKAS